MLLVGRVGFPHKILEAYMDEAVWPAEPPGAYLSIVLRVVVVFLGKHKDEQRNGLSEMEVYMSAQNSHP